MPISVADALQRVKILLQDGTSTRWPLPELVAWIADGAREIALQQPSATAVTVTLDLEEGTRQSVSADLYQSIDEIICNITPANGQPASAVNMTTRQQLDTQNRSWHDPDRVAYRPLVLNAVTNPLDPLTFYVYPGNTGEGQVRATLSAIPILAPAITEDPTLDASYAAMFIPLSNVFLSAIVDYTCYRAYSKDSQIEGAAMRAQAHLGLFSGALAARSQTIAAANAAMMRG